MKFTVLWSLSWSCLLELVFHLIRHPSTMERLFKKNNNHICQVQLLTICHYSTFTYIPNTCCSCSSHSVNLLFLGSWKKSTQVTAEYRKIKLYSQTFCSDEGQTLTTSVRNSTWWPIHIINSLSVDKTKLSLSCNNIYEKITHVWLAENKCIFNVTKVRLQMACVLPKFLHSWLSAMHFSCKLLTIINIERDVSVFSRAWDKEKIPSLHKESNLRPSDPAYC